ncbi:hypothetical protein HK098_004137 [Nowakowskiella sp. JEL0407]|nr:hypothetical protein HK098_004137 [Nowakowskiella sp. JEL0407]
MAFLVNAHVKSTNVAIFKNTSKIIFRLSKLRMSKVNVSLAQKQKEKGNEYFSKGNFSAAVTEYTNGLSQFRSSSYFASFTAALGLTSLLSPDNTSPQNSTPTDTENSNNSFSKEEQTKLLTSLLSNRSACYSNLRKYNEALVDADEIITLEPDWVKGHFRKGEALLGKRLLNDALKSYQKAWDLDPSNTILLRIEKVKRILKDQQLGIVIHQLRPGSDICQKSVFSPIQSLIFDFAMQFRNFVYIIENISSRDCIVVDACWDIEGILNYCKTQGLNIVACGVTHHHIDHVGGIPPPPYDSYRIRVDGLSKLLTKLPQIDCFVNPNDIDAILKANPEISPDRLKHTSDGQIIALPLSKYNELESQSFIPSEEITSIEILHTPGHTAGSQCLLVNGVRLLTGDTLFIGSCGRCDFPDSSREDMWLSLQEKLGGLANDIVVFPGHDYGGESTTIGDERQHGLLRPIAKEVFIEQFGSKM